MSWFGLGALPPREQYPEAGLEAVDAALETAKERNACAVRTSTKHTLDQMENNDNIRRTMDALMRRLERERPQ